MGKKKKTIHHSKAPFCNQSARVGHCTFGVSGVDLGDFDDLLLDPSRLVDESTDQARSKGAATLHVGAARCDGNQAWSIRPRPNNGEEPEVVFLYLRK